MSRTVITAVVAGVIAALTAIAYFVTASSFAERTRKDADAQLTRAYQLIQRLNTLELVDVRNKAERLAAQPELVTAIRDQAERATAARTGFLRFTAGKKQETATRPDIIALVGKDGEMLAMYEVPTVVPKQWIPPDDPRRKSIIQPLNHILVNKDRVIISDIWNYGDRGMMKVGVAPVIDPDGGAEGEILGAVVVAYAQTAKNAQQDRALLGTEIAYYDKSDRVKQVLASSFTRGAGNEEDTAKARQLGELLGGQVSENASKQRITIDGVDYVAAAVKLPRSATKELPLDYPPVTAGVVLLAPVGDASNTAGPVKLLLLLLGIGALAIAMLGLYLSHRRLIAQVDQIEVGVTDIINGNVDRTFRPVGLELDGLANGLNVMLARLLGRPEPGEEEFDDDGNPIIQGRVEFDEGEDRPAPDPDLAALAQESEPDYYKRVYTEYLGARRASGTPDEVSFENFIAKLKVNEGKLKAQYQCRAVRFRVITKDGKVSLKPVPIFA